LEPRRNQLQASHTNLASLLDAVNPSLQVAYGKDPARAFGNDAPELVLLDATYGENAGVLWLMPQLFAIGEYAGVREKMDEQQTMELARVISTKFGHLTVTELLYFFFNLKAGKYGKFFGVVDPMVITEALGKFLDERDKYLTKVQQDAARAERESYYNRPDVLKPHEVEALRARLEKKWAEEEEKAKQENNNQ